MVSELRSDRLGHSPVDRAHPESNTDCADPSGEPACLRRRDCMHRRFNKLLLASVLAGIGAVGCNNTVAPGGALVSGERGITSIAVDDFFLYWTNVDGTIKRVSLDGGHPTTLVSGQSGPSHLRID